MNSQKKGQYTSTAQSKKQLELCKAVQKYDRIKNLYMSITMYLSLKTIFRRVVYIIKVQ